MEGIAFDTAMSNPRSDSIHIDLGPKREWGERFAPRPAFARETRAAIEEMLSDYAVIMGERVVARKDGDWPAAPQLHAASALVDSRQLCRRNASTTQPLDV